MKSHLIILDLHNVEATVVIHGQDGPSSDSVDQFYSTYAITLAVTVRSRYSHSSDWRQHSPHFRESAKNVHEGVIFLLNWFALQHLWSYGQFLSCTRTVVSHE